MGIKAFFKNAFSDMKEDAKAQYEEAKAMGDPARRKGVMQAKRDEQIHDADKRRAEAEARIDAVKK